IEELQAVKLDATVEREITCVNAGIVVVNAEGGSGNYTYTLFSTNFINPIVSKDEHILIELTNIDDTTESPFDIEVSVIDEFGCSIGSIVVPMYIAQPPAEPTVHIASCDPENGATLTINMSIGGEEPYKYSVDGGKTFQDSNVFENRPVGIYDVVVIDNNGCESSAAAPVEIYKPLQVDVRLTQELYCINNIAEVTMEVLSGGSGNFKFDVEWVEGNEWDIEGGAFDVNPKLIQFGDAGTYNITIHDEETECVTKK